jgi:hypothetical protein
MYSKFYYSSELLYVIIFIILSISSILLCFYLQEAKIEKYALLISSLIVLLFFCFKICASDIKKTIKKKYIIEIMLYILLFSNLIFLEQKLYQNIFIFINETVFIVSLSINCRILTKKISKETYLINKKTKSDFYTFFNNELCFYSFTSYLNKKDSDLMILVKIYLEINKYKMKFALNEDLEDKTKIIKLYNNNRQNIKNRKRKEKIDKMIESTNEMINKGMSEKDAYDEIFTFIFDILNKEFSIFKKTRDYKKLFSFLDLVYFLDEYIFIESLYYDCYENEKLQSN